MMHTTTSHSSGDVSAAGAVVDPVAVYKYDEINFADSLHTVPRRNNNDDNDII